MFPFPFSGLRLVHDKKVHDAMERARIDAELVRGSRRTVQLYQLRNVLILTISKLNIFVWIGHLVVDRVSSQRKIRATVVNRAVNCFPASNIA